MINPKQKQELFLFLRPSDLISAAVCPIPLRLRASPPQTSQQPSAKRSPQAEAASAQRLHTSHGRLRQSKDNGCKLRAGTAPFHPVGQGAWEEATARWVLAACWEARGAAAMPVAAAGVRERMETGPGAA